MNRSLLLFLAMLCVPAATAWAGPNANGTIVAHDANFFFSQTNGSQTLCVQGNALTDCGTADTRVDGALSISTAKKFAVYAVFLNGSSPRLMGITWGVQYDGGLMLPYHGMCGDFELSDEGWPASGTGSTVTWNTPQTGLITRFYWFGAYQYSSSPALLTLTPNPTQGGYFGDDAVPSTLDPIAGYSSIGFGMNGTAACPVGYGACCDGAGACMMTTQDGCTGTWLGSGSYCDPNPCLQPGPCCNPATGACTMVLESECQPPLVWHGDWTSCVPNYCPQPGACCSPATGVCTITLPLECHAPSEFHPEWTSCDPNPCPQRGACCDPYTGHCSLTLIWECGNPGIWHGEWTSCLPNPCPDPQVLGACCDPNTGMCSLTIVSECYYPNEFHSEWTTCDPNPCPGEAPCCIWNGECRMYTQPHCESLPNATWHPEWTSCDPNPCPPICGACCTPEGGCTVTPLWECPPPNTWYDPWDFCDPNPCPRPEGACCHTSGYCEITHEDGCPAPFVWHPEWTACEPNPCPQPVRVCCDPATGECSLTTEADCTDPDIWHPEWTSCAPNPCPYGVPTERSSWGQIKHVYR